MRSSILALALFAASAAATAPPVSHKLDPNHTSVLASWSHHGYPTLSAHFGKVVGALADAVHSDSTGITRIILVDGTKSRVQGAYPVIKPGMLVNTPSATYHGPKLYCLAIHSLL